MPRGHARSTGRTNTGSQTRTPTSCATRATSGSSHSRSDTTSRLAWPAASACAMSECTPTDTISCCWTGSRSSIPRRGTRTVNTTRSSACSTSARPSCFRRLPAMNREFRIAIAVFGLLGTTGCQGVLDVTPKDQFPDAAVFADPNLAQAFLNDTYRGLGHGLYEIMLASMTDETHFIHNYNTE